MVNPADNKEMKMVAAAPQAPEMTFAEQYAAAVKLAAFLIRRYGCDSKWDAELIVANCWELRGKIDPKSIRNRFKRIHRGTQRRKPASLPTSTIDCTPDQWAAYIKAAKKGGELQTETGELVESPRESVDVEAAIMEVLPPEFQDAARSFANGETFGASKDHFYKLEKPLYNLLCELAGVDTHIENKQGKLKLGIRRQIHGFKPVQNPSLD